MSERPKDFEITRSRRTPSPTWLKTMLLLKLGITVPNLACGGEEPLGSGGTTGIDDEATGDTDTTEATSDTEGINTSTNGETSGTMTEGTTGGPAPEPLTCKKLTEDLEVFKNNPEYTQSDIDAYCEGVDSLSTEYGLTVDGDQLTVEGMSVVTEDLVLSDSRYFTGGITGNPNDTSTVALAGSSTPDNLNGKEAYEYQMALAKQDPTTIPATRDHADQIAPAILETVENGVAVFTYEVDEDATNKPLEAPDIKTVFEGVLTGTDEDHPLKTFQMVAMAGGNCVPNLEKGNTDFFKQYGFGIKVNGEYIPLNNHFEDGVHTLSVPNNHPGIYAKSPSEILYIQIKGYVFADNDGKPICTIPKTSETSVTHAYNGERNPGFNNG